MPIDIAIPLIVGMAVLFVLLGAARAFGGRSRGWTRRSSIRQWRPRAPYSRNQSLGQPSRIPDAADQLRAVENANYGAQPLLRFQEGLVFAAAEAAVREAGVSWRVFAQVSLGEVLTCEDRDGFNAINAKRVDLLLTDHRFTPMAAIEYQGSGHHMGKAAARDAVKREALRKAGIAFIEITADHGPEDVRREIGRLAFAKTRDPRKTLQKVTGA